MQVIRKLRTIKVLILLQLVYFLLRIFKIDRVLQLLLPAIAKGSSKLTLAEIEDLICSASWRFSWLNSCLPKSIVLCRMLRQAGIDSSVKIGVKNQNFSSRQFRAHAWVESGDGAVFDTPGVSSKDYAVLK